ncbi:hypothetical protein N665_1450s0009 [Sinapis alba]|nr:hypothetical protein N665_1450s0009 [Sinapis alba]
MILNLKDEKRTHTQRSAAAYFASSSSFRTSLILSELELAEGPNFGRRRGRKEDNQKETTFRVINLGRE